MMSSKHVEQSSAAAIASKINSLTSPSIDEKRSRTLRATWANAQHKTMNAELINKSDIDDILTFAVFSAKSFFFRFSAENFSLLS